MLWDDFLNSKYHDWRGGDRSEDRLDKPGWLKQWAADHQYPDAGQPEPEETEILKSLRSLMFRVVRTLVAGETVPQEAVEQLNQALSDGPFLHRLIRTEEGFRMETAALRKDWAGIRADIAASFCGVLTEGDTTRLRICENPDCLWIYYDETRNRSKRFCDDKMCGNLIKVRRFRARRKAARSHHSSEQE